MGNLSSGKSALVHRYLTGTYVQEESPEGKNSTPLMQCVYSDSYIAINKRLHNSYRTGAVI